MQFTAHAFTLNAVAVVHSPRREPTDDFWGGLPLTAAFLCAELEIPGRLQHPEYIANWAAVLRADNKAIWTAGARATEAVHFLHKAAGFTECAQDAAA